MRALSLLLVPLAVTTPALADPGASEPVELLFEDSLDVFQGLELDTGVLPPGSPLGVQVIVASNGGWATEIAGWSDLWWPDALSHGLSGVPEGGWMGLSADLSIAALVVVDLSDIGLGLVTVPVWTESLLLEDETTFDGLLLQDSGVQEVTVSTDGQVIGPWEYTQSIFTGVNLVFKASAFPRARATLTGIEAETEDAVGEKWIYRQEAQAGVFDVPLDDPGRLSLTSTLVTDLDAAFEIVVVPEVEVCAPVIGCLTLVSFDIPIPLTSVREERGLGPVAYEHPLPALDLDLLTHDFGEVQVGNTVNLEVPLGNLGHLDLEGEASLDAEGAFTVFPQAFYAPEGVVDGVVVSFTPPEAGDFTAVLTLQSNDPANPAVTVPLLGRGVDPPPPATISVENGCGCATGAPGSPPLGLLALGLVALSRRRRA